MKSLLKKTERQAFRRKRVLFRLTLFLFSALLVCCFACDDKEDKGDIQVAGDDDTGADDDASDDEDDDDEENDDDDDSADDDDDETLICDVTEYGAKGDGVTKDTAAIQAAIDDCALQGGGIVTLPAGTYLSGSVNLKSRITLRVESGAVLQGTQDRADWTEDGLINALSLQDIAIEGEGTIDGNGAFWWQRDVLGLWRPSRLVKIVDSSNVAVRKVTLRMSPKWTLHLLACDDVLIENIRIRNAVGGRFVSPNTDGIDLEACRHVEVVGCDIETGDDCIALKNGEDEWRRESYDIEVRDCVLSGWANGFKIGTETERDLHDIVFRDSIVRASVDSNPGTRNISAVTIISDDGANVYDVTIENIHIQQIRAPFFIRLQKRLRGDLIEPGTISNIVLRDILVDDASLTASIMGIPGHRIDAVTLENIEIASSEGGSAWQKEIVPPEREDDYPDAVYFGKYPAYGIFARHVAGCLAYLNDVTIRTTQSDERPEIVYDDTHQVNHIGLDAETWIYDRTGDNEDCAGY